MLFSSRIVRRRRWRRSEENWANRVLAYEWRMNENSHQTHARILWINARDAIGRRHRQRQWPKPNDKCLKLNIYSSFALSCGAVLHFVVAHPTARQISKGHHAARLYSVSGECRMKAGAHINSHSFGVFSPSLLIYLLFSIRSYAIWAKCLRFHYNIRYSHALLNSQQLWAEWNTLVCIYACVRRKMERRRKTSWTTNSHLFVVHQCERET